MSECKTQWVLLFYFYASALSCVTFAVTSRCEGPT